MYSTVEKCVENANAEVQRQWRLLPALTTRAHLPILQISQQIIELSESNAVRCARALCHASNVNIPIHRLQMCNAISSAYVQSSNPISAIMSEIKSTSKTWRNRNPIVADQLFLVAGKKINEDHRYRLGAGGRI